MTHFLERYGKWPRLEGTVGKILLSFLRTVEELTAELRSRGDPQDIQALEAMTERWRRGFKGELGMTH